MKAPWDSLDLTACITVARANSLAAARHFLSGPTERYLLIILSTAWAAAERQSLIYRMAGTLTSPSVNGRLEY